MNTPMKLGFLSLLLAQMALGASETTYIRQTIPEKAAARDLLFLLTFDKHNMHADLAQGSPDSFTHRDLDLGLRGIMGFDGQAAYAAEPNTFVRYLAKDNVSLKEGTLSFWFNSRNYAPADPVTDGQRRGHSVLVNINIRQADGRGVIYGVSEDANMISFGCSPMPWVWEDHVKVACERRGHRRDTWYHAVCTWDETSLAFYINGECMGTVAKKARTIERIADLKVENGPQATIGIRPGGDGDLNQHNIAIDDVAIYSRKMGAFEVGNAYRKLVQGGTRENMHAFGVDLNGVVTACDDKLDRLEATFDLFDLSEQAERRLSRGQLPMGWRLTAPDGTERTGTFHFAARRESHVFSGVNQPGKWTLTATVDGKTENVSAVRPDTAWLGNGLGEEDTVPEPWSPMTLTDRTVGVWGRECAFGAGPLPERITIFGDNLLAERPRLLVNGIEPTWCAGETKRQNRRVVFTGAGTCGTARLTYETTVEFDGAIRFDWQILGQPAIDTMQLAWRVEPRHAHWLMTPHVCEAQEDPVTFAYPRGCEDPKLLWLTTEKIGGFCFTMPNDANWVHGADEKIFSANRRTGACRVNLITRRVDKMPEATPYTALFVATPTRPLPKRNRAIRLGIGPEAPLHFHHSSGEGFFSTFTHVPMDVPQFAARYEPVAPNGAGIYGGLRALTSRETEAVYFDKYWDRPGDYQYLMSQTVPQTDGSLKATRVQSRAACANTPYADYMVWCENKMWQHPLANRFWLSNFDLTNVKECANPLHGCRYADKFDRKVSTLDVLSLRRLTIRLIALAHKYGKVIEYHGQREFSPFVQGLVDYWEPGEQNSALLSRNLNGYTDEIPDAIYRTEYNRDVMGTGILHLPSIGYGLRKPEGGYTTQERKNWKYTWGMLTMLMMHDIETVDFFTSYEPIRQVWDTMDAYRLDDPATRCVLYYAPDEQMPRCSNAALRLTRYDCADGRRLLVVANKTPQAQTGTIDFGANGPASCRDELSKQVYKVRQGRIDMTVPPRMMLLIGVPAPLAQNGKM